MSILNDVRFIGRLTNTPELKVTRTGYKLVNCSLAINETYTIHKEDNNNEKKERVLFIEFHIWNRLAEVLHPMLVKGKKIAIQGELVQDIWIDDTNQKRTKIYVNVNELHILDKKENQYDTSSQYAASTGQYATTSNHYANNYESVNQYDKKQYTQSNKSVPGHYSPRPFSSYPTPSVAQTPAMQQMPVETQITPAQIPIKPAQTLTMTDLPTQEEYNAMLMPMQDNLMPGETKVIPVQPAEKPTQQETQAITEKEALNNIFPDTPKNNCPF